MPGERAPSVVIVGAGFGGLAAAIELRRHGFTDIVVLERAASGIGGTWRYNVYPGCACDVPSHLYSFSFAQRRDWSRLCSPQDEILAYLTGVAREYHVDRHVVCGADVVSCEWNDGWTVTCADGRVWGANAVVVATGQLHQPAVPAIPGRFEGRAFHSARWDPSYDLRGKRVAVIGTGASAVQLVPEVAGEAGRLYVFQRSGNWFWPRRNRPYPAWLRVVMKRVPGVQELRRQWMYRYIEVLTLMIRHPRTIGLVGRAWSTAFMRRQLRDPDVRRRAWPDYTFGCKRILFSSRYLPALQRPNVELVTDPIARFEPGGIVTGDGVCRDVDCVIYGTGFKTTAFMLPMRVVGRGGRTLEEEWAGGPHAHFGMCVTGFPSLFLVYGPNTNTSGGSIIAYEEAQARYIRQALSLVRERGARAIEVRREVEAASAREVQARFAGTAWTQCNSWYRDETGRIVTNWPGYMDEYVRRVRDLDPGDFEFVAPVDAYTRVGDD
ncbi:MAG: flavin-containing monooxygenase [Solirubrobacteraceae bacterium]